MLQGFQILHSLGGGTGSGIGSTVLERFQDEYPDQVVSTYTVLPSSKVLFFRNMQIYFTNSFDNLLHLSLTGLTQLMGIIKLVKTNRK